MRLVLIADRAHDVGGISGVPSVEDAAQLSLSAWKLSASSMSRVGEYFSTIRKSDVGEMFKLRRARGTRPASSDSVVVLPQRFSGEVSASSGDAAAASSVCPLRSVTAREQIFRRLSKAAKRWRTQRWSCRCGAVDDLAEDIVGSGVEGGRARSS